MKFINTKGIPDFFIYLSSRMTVGKDGIELSNENRQLLWAALQVPWLQVVPQDEALAANIRAMYDSSLGLEKKEVDSSPALPRTVTFHNTTDQETYVLAYGSKHIVAPNGEIVLSGLNKELVANAFLNDKLELVEDKEKVTEGVKQLVSKKKEEAAKEKEELARLPKTPQRAIPKAQLSEQEIQKQSTNLNASTSNPTLNQPRFENEPKVSDELKGELEKGIIPNAPGSTPAGGLRIV